MRALNAWWQSQNGTRNYETIEGRTLTWAPDLGVGYYPVEDQPYDEAYWDKYVGYADTDLGRRLNRLRLGLVNRMVGGAQCIDIGIGCGAFVEARGDTFGYDINPVAVEWLRRESLWSDPTRASFPVATFWDSLEHIYDPAPILANVTQAAFVSMPIYTDLDDLLASKHLRPDEHCWYFTHDGLVRFMAGHGFRLSVSSDMETLAGREAIHTFVFDREEAR